MTDLTREKPIKALLKFALPMVLSVAFQQVYNIADKVIAGKFAGEDALAAVSASYPLTMIIMAFALGTNAGCSVVISGMYGGKKYKDVKSTISTSLMLAIVAGAVLSLISLILCDPVLKFLNTPDNIMYDSAVYLRVYLYGFAFLYLYNVCTGAFNALGNSKTPLYFLIGSSIGNIILDYIFVAVFQWGVAGVAWATFIAQGISSVLSLVALIFEVNKLETEGHVPLFSKNSLHRILTIAVPSIVQQSFVSVGGLFIQGLVNSFGSSAIAGYGAAIQLNTFAITVFATSANAVSNFTAQNMGRGLYDRVKEGFRAALKIDAVIAIPFVALYTLLSKTMIGLFMDEPTAAALETGRQFLYIVAPFYFVVMVKLTVDGLMRGAAAVKYFMISTFSDLLLRVVLAYILTPYFGSTGIWMSWPVGWTLSAALAVSFYVKGLWRRHAAAPNTHTNSLDKQ
ncbi:MAG: MATE family efflux transporter [Clostridia bacterium]|nr:MATE family efflux transporter [Clostridia bacterium]